MLDIPVLSGLLGSGIHWFLFKIALFIFMYYWLRWTLPRFRYDQLMGLCWKVFLPIILANILVTATLKLILFNPGLALFQSNPGIGWTIMLIVQMGFGALALYGFSKLAGIGWFGKPERPVLVDRPLIMVRTVQGGRGTITGEARTVTVTRNSERG